MNLVFSDLQVNEMVPALVRGKVRQAVADPRTPELLVPTRYRMGHRRLIVDTGYYDIFDRDIVTLVEISRDASCGSPYRHSDPGRSRRDRPRGVRARLGRVHGGLVGGPASASVLGNMVLDNVQHTDFICRLLRHRPSTGTHPGEPTLKAEDARTAHVAEAPKPFIRLTVHNLMVYVNDETAAGSSSLTPAGAAATSIRASPSPTAMPVSASARARGAERPVPAHAGRHGDQA